MRLGYLPVDFAGCNITSNYQSILNCPASAEAFWRIGLYQASIAAQDEPITLFAQERLGNLTETVLGPRNSSKAFYDQYFNGFIDAAIFGLYMTEERANYFTYSNPFSIPSRVCFYMNPKSAEQQLLIDDDYWLQPYPIYAWIFILFIIFYFSLLNFSRYSKLLNMINELTLGFICLYYSSSLRAELLETSAVRFPYSSVSQIANAVSLGRVRITVK